MLYFDSYKLIEDKNVSLNIFMANRPSAKEIIEKLNLEPHPEGGYYRETYRGNEEVKRGNGASRNAGTAIYFLLTSGVCTEWHRFGADELWHFYTGDKLVIETVDPEGNFKQFLLGEKITGDEHFQQLIPKHCWQRAYCTGQYSLAATTVFPGFEFDDLEMIDRQKLADRYPDNASNILHNPFSDN